MSAGSEVVGGGAAGSEAVHEVAAALALIETWWELWLVVVAGVAGAAIAPAVVAHTSRTRAPTPAQRDHLRAAGVPPERVRVLAAGESVGAFAAGLSPRLGRVFVTTELCRELDAEEVAAVACHEYGHLARRHVPLRLGVPVAFALAWVAGARLAPGSEFLVGLGLLVPTVGLSLVTSRWTEFDADAFVRTRTDGEALASALSRLAAAGHVADGGRLSRHPPLDGRIGRLDDPDGE
ncbi:MAG: M48 family metallopeptidase [Halobaculum sp.]